MWEKPMGESLYAPHVSHSCYKEYASLRRVTPLFPGELSRDWIDEGSTPVYGPW